jgi:hypothetical protein
LGSTGSNPVVSAKIGVIMSVSVDNFSTSKFTLRTQEEADHVKKLVELLKDESNLYGGYLSGDCYANIFENGDLTFQIDTGGYCDGGPDIKRSVAYPAGEGDETEYYDDDYVNLWSEIQDRLVEGTYFIVFRHTIDSGLAFGMSIYKSDGSCYHRNEYDTRKELLKEAGIEDKE